MGSPGVSGVLIFLSGVLLARQHGLKAGPVFGVGWGGRASKGKGGGDRDDRLHI